MRRRRIEQTPLNAEINVVSLIDVMMLLLVIFMITAPMMQGGIDVRLPQGEARPMDPKSGLIVTVRENGRVAIDNDEMSFEQFKLVFRSQAEPQAKQGVYLRGDARVAYGDVVKVIDVMKRAGATSIGLVVEPTIEQ